MHIRQMDPNQLEPIPHFLRDKHFGFMMYYIIHACGRTPTHPAAHSSAYTTHLILSAWRRRSQTFYIEEVFLERMITLVRNYQNALKDLFTL